MNIKNLKKKHILGANVLHRFLARAKSERRLGKELVGEVGHVHDCKGDDWDEDECGAIEEN